MAHLPAIPTKVRKVKGGTEPATDAADRHERAKDFLAPNEVARLLDAAKAGRRGTCDHLLLMA